MFDTVNNMNIRMIKYNTKEYEESLKIRDEVLRKPWNRSISEDDLTLEKELFDILLGSFAENKLTGLIVLHPIDDQEIQIKYLCVYEEYSKKGIGKKLVEYSEKYAYDNDFSKITLDSREWAVNFYENLKYKVVGKSFIPEFVSIVHTPMEKTL